MSSSLSFADYNLLQYEAMPPMMEHERRWLCLALFSAQQRPLLDKCGCSSNDIPHIVRRQPIQSESVDQEHEANVCCGICPSHIKAHNCSQSVQKQHTCYIAIFQ